MYNAICPFCGSAEAETRDYVKNPHLMGANTVHIMCSNCGNKYSLHTEGDTENLRIALDKTAHGLKTIYTEHTEYTKLKSELPRLKHSDTIVQHLTTAFKEIVREVK